MPALCSAKLEEWIRTETYGSSVVVDFGAGFFDKLNCVSHHAKKIGIEVFPSYCAYAKPGIRVVCDDMRNWAAHIKGPECDTAMLIDTIEHLPKDDGLKLLRELTESFRKVIVFTPEGFYPQDADVTGFGNEWQVHESGWTADEFHELGFAAEVDPTFHKESEGAPQDGGAIFAAWERCA